MRQRSTVVVAIAVLCVVGTGGALRRTRGSATNVAVEQPVALSAPAPAAGSKDDLAWATALDQGQGSAKEIAASFREGHAAPKVLAPEAVTRSKGRFEVRLPSGAPITTPAVHQGKVLFSGGFHGKEFYAVDVETGHPAWGVDLDDDGPSAPACADGVCVFNTESCTIFALDAATGKQRWAFWMGDPMMSAPAIASGVVFTSYPLGALGQAFGNMGNYNNVQNNQQAVQQQIDPQTLVPALQSQVRAADASHAVVALDLQTGAVKWQRNIDGDIVSAPVASGDSLYFSTFSGSVFTLAQSDGALRAIARGRATSAPTVVGGDVFWSTRSESQGAAREALVRADASSNQAEQHYAEKSAPYLDVSVQASSSYSQKGALLDTSNGFSSAPSTAKAGVALGNVGQGTVSGLQSFQGSRVASDGRDNFSTMGDEVVCTDATTGTERWRRKIDGDLSAGGSLATSPALVGSHLVVGTLEGSVLVIDRASGKIERTLSIGHPVRAQPAVEDGWVYVGTEDGLLVGIDTGDRSLDGWPMWGGDAGRTASLR